jgi:hypothetical protein
MKKLPPYYTENNMNTFRYSSKVPDIVVRLQPNSEFLDKFPYKFYYQISRKSVAAALIHANRTDRQTGRHDESNSRYICECP